MTQHQIDVLDMQCWAFRMAQTRWHLSAEDCSSIFQRYEILQFMEECYDILHLSSYMCVLDDIEKLIRNKEARV